MARTCAFPSGASLEEPIPSKFSVLVFAMLKTFNAVIKQDGSWWIGWVEEIPGVNCQGETRSELIENLQFALAEALEPSR